MIAELLTFWKKNNGHAPAPEPQLVDAPAPEPQLVGDWQMSKMHEALQPLLLVSQQLTDLVELLVQPTATPQPPWHEVVSELERVTQRVLVAARQPPEPEWATKWASRIESDLEESDKRLARLASDISQNMSNDMARFYVDVSKDLRPPDVEPALTALTGELSKLTDLTGLIRELVDVTKKKVVEKAPAKADRPDLKDDPPPGLPAPILAPPSPKESKAITRSAKPIVLEEFNTIEMEEFVIYELHPLEEGVFNANVLNLGPGWLYMRENDEPTIGDPKATTLPPGGIDNEIRVSQRLYVLASADGSITVRLMH